MSAALIQPYYPVNRGGRRGYAKTETLSAAEIEWNAERMEKSGNPLLLRHACALREYSNTAQTKPSK